MTNDPVTLDELPDRIKASAAYMAGVLATTYTAKPDPAHLAPLHHFEAVEAAALDAYLDAYLDVLNYGTPADPPYEVAQSLAMINSRAGIDAYARAVAYASAALAARAADAKICALETLGA